MNIEQTNITFYGTVVRSKGLGYEERILNRSANSKISIKFNLPVSTSLEIASFACMLGLNDRKLRISL
jgi:hypothetical protein